MSTETMSTPTMSIPSEPADDDATAEAGVASGAITLAGDCTTGVLGTCAAVHAASGVCGARLLICSPEGAWPPSSACAPAPGDVEVCDAAGLDENCDGQSNEGCTCVAGETATCGAIYGSLGDCGNRTLSCSSDGAWPGADACAPGADAVEVCEHEGHDENCNGVVNEPPQCPVFTSLSATVGPVTARFCGVATDSGVYCWGPGPVGDGSRTNRALPVRVLDNARQVLVGDFSTCAVLNTGAVYCWRSPSSLFTTATQDVLSPVNTGLTIPSGATFEMDDSHACVLRADGSVGCWYDVPLSTAPTPVAGVEGVVSLSVAQRVGCAALSDGTVRCWGGAGGSQLGDGMSTLNDYSTSVQALGIRQAIQVKVTDDEACALSSTGSVQCWGTVEEGAFGIPIRAVFGSTYDRLSAYLGIDGQGAVESLSPVTVPGVTDAIDLPSVDCVIRRDRSVFCWTPIQSLTPFEGAVGVRSFVGRANSACMLLDTGLTRCAGPNTAGQVGIGTVSPSASGQVLGP